MTRRHPRYNPDPDQEPDVEAAKAQTARLSASNSIQIVVPACELKRINSEYLESAIKKCLVYGESIVVVSGPRRLHIEEIGNTESWDGKHSPTFDRIREIARGSIHVDDIHYLPQFLDSMTSGYDANGSRQEDSPLPLFSFDDEYKNARGLRVDFNNPLVQKRLFEEHQESYKNTVNVWLPRVSGIDLDTFCQLRRDEDEAFSRMRYSFAQFLKNSPTSNEHDIIELIDMVDYEIGNLKHRLESTKRRSRHALSEMLLGMGAVGLCL